MGLSTLDPPSKLSLRGGMSQSLLYQGIPELIEIDESSDSSDSSDEWCDDFGQKFISSQNTCRIAWKFEHT